jgi:hypothetical protein
MSRSAVRVRSSVLFFFRFAGKTSSTSKTLSSCRDRSTATRLTEGALRSVGSVTINSAAHHVVALADSFGVHPSYSFDRGRKLLIINQEALEIMRDKRSRKVRDS